MTMARRILDSTRTASFLLDDGSVEGFEEFGGWLTAHEGIRPLPSAASADEVQAHDHYGANGLDRTDIRKYIPQACAGEWWENDWRQIRSRQELEQLKQECSSTLRCSGPTGATR